MDIWPWNIGKYMEVTPKSHRQLQYHILNRGSKPPRYTIVPLFAVSVREASKVHTRKRYVLGHFTPATSRDHRASACAGAVVSNWLLTYLATAHSAEFI